MSPERKAARDKLLAMNSRADLEDYLESLNLSDEERTVALLVFGRGFSLTQTALELGYSPKQMRKRMSKIYDRML